MKYKSTRHVKYLCNYHFVWIPKYRKAVLEPIAEELKQTLINIAEELGCDVLTIEIMQDHIHLFVNCPPRYAPSYLANYFKGKSARQILKKHPELKIKDGLWTRNYFVATAGNVSTETIKKYIESQKVKEDEEE
ncbi:IS200/IS605 family transposase [Sulfolobus tengchongensis]|uniref:IS200/IS605 family transposase n=1 Tax=Sulfolobus tengchongensis TaxID=207809 RepID=A0AAX4KYY9_9CREN